jgi:rod shape-determining protein MreC
LKWAIVAAIIVAILTLITVTRGPLWAVDATVGLRQTLASGMRAMVAYVSWYGDVPRLGREHQRTTADRNMLAAEVVRLQAVERENQLLRQQLNVMGDRQQRQVVAQVAGTAQQGPATYLLINRGLKDGIRDGQIVLSNGVLVGKTKTVGQTTATVVLPQSLGSTIPVIIHSKQATARGIVEGDYNLSAKLNQVLLSDTLEEGAFIVTTAEGGAWPPNLVVGKVGPIQQGQAGTFKSATVQLLWDLNQLEFITVVIE